LVLFCKTEPLSSETVSAIMTKQPSQFTERELAWTALAGGDMATLSRAFTAMCEGRPEVEVTLQDPAGPPRSPQAVRCRIGGGGLTLELPAAAMATPGLKSLGERLLRTLPVFAACMRHHPAAQGRLTLNTGDLARIPGIGYCTNVEGVHLIPDPDFLSSRGYQTIRDNLNQQRIAWSDRKPVAFWRGTAIGRGEAGASHWLSLPQVALCQRAQTRADMFDVGLSSLHGKPAAPGQEANPAAALMRPFVNPWEFQNYRYQIHIDAVANSWAGLFQRLLTGSPVLKIQSPQNYRRWYHDRLEPWQHYVPVAADMSDLVEKTAWLIGHDGEAQRIGAEARALAESLTYESELVSGAASLARALA
jgi:hypothetical protein